MKIKVYGEKILGELIKDEEKTSSGIILQETNLTKEYKKVKIKSVGDKLKGYVKEGTFCLLGIYSGVTIQNEIVFNLEDIICEVD